MDEFIDIVIKAFPIICSILFLVLSFFNFTVNVNIEPEKSEQRLNFVNSIVLFIFIIAIAAVFDNKKTLAVSIIIYLLTMLLRKMQVLSAMYDRIEKLEKNVEYYKKCYYDEKDKAKKEIDFQRQIADEYREANRELHRKLYSKDKNEGV